MEYIYSIVLTVFVLLCCLKYFDIHFDKKWIIWFIAVLGGSLITAYLNFPYFIQLTIRVVFVYEMIRSYMTKERNMEIIAMILLIETIAKSSYYGFVLVIPLILQINIVDVVLSHCYEIQIIILFMVFFLLMKVYRSFSALKVRCDHITYALIAACGMISLYGLDVIPKLGYQIEEDQLYFLLLCFVYVVIFNIIIFIYHNKQTQKEISQRISLEQLQILKQEKEIISVQRQMIDNIRHDLNYFQSMVNEKTKKHIDETIKKIDDYHDQFIFHDHLLNNFIYRMKSAMKENHKDLKMIITTTNIVIDLNTYNQLISVMKYVIESSVQDHIQFRIQKLDGMTVFEFTYCPYQNQKMIFHPLLNNKNIVLSQRNQHDMVCSLIMEGENLK